MQCERREHLLAEYRKTMAELGAICDREAIDRRSAGAHPQVSGAFAATERARVDLREHVEEHGCWSHAVYSSLFFLWRNQRVDTTAALDDRSKGSILTFRRDERVARRLSRKLYSGQKA
jgi:hypothetical protein